MIKLIKIKGGGRGVIPTMSDLNFIANNKKNLHQDIWSIAGSGSLTKTRDIYVKSVTL